VDRLSIVAHDKFQEIVQQALGEQFEILSVTFQDEKVNSRSVPGEYGWRYTPYAYMLIKARSPSVDKIPPVRLDFDFLDTSGYVILPVESAVVPIDAAKDASETRPFSKLEVVQTLDERQASEGKLVLEVKATARGLVPDLKEILDVKPKEFDVVQTDDQGLSVSKFDADSPDNVVNSERSWLVTLNAKKDLAQRPKNFEFAEATLDDVKLVYQRYVDADLSEAQPIVSLEARYGTPRRMWPWILGGVLAVVAIGGVGAAVIASRPRAQGASHRYAIPDDLTPFNVLGLLREIQQNDGLNEAGHRQLTVDIQRIERYYFAANGEDAAPDLKQIAESWAGQAR
jgi:hypothetical protein